MLDQIRRNFPDADAEAVVQEAVAHVAAHAAEGEAHVKAEDRAARAAEHDLGRSIHD